MLPGQHVIVIGTASDALLARAQGLLLRDTITILLPGPRVLSAFLFRAPLEGTVAQNVLTHGVGGLWIDGCRIGVFQNTTPGGRSRYNAALAVQGYRPSAYAKEDPPAMGAAGRWPTNLLLVHGPECERLGERGIRARGHVPRTGQTVSCFGPNNHAGGPVNNGAYADEDGTETVPAYECQPDCPVRLLDGQSGVRSSHDTRDASGFRSEAIQDIGFLRGSVGTLPPGRADSGGASRFYPQFTDLAGALDWLDRLVVGP